MDVHRVPVFGKEGEAPLTQKYEYFGSPPHVQMNLTPQQLRGLAWLLMTQLSLEDPLVFEHFGGPWFCVTGEDKWAIWDTTGAVYRIEDGAVEDDPIYTPPTMED